ncbi:MAG: hypothetical protein ABW125_19395 [Candidatus Thiodiazotropha lotti]|nr:hypothetical protein [Candidatus Thiodiazotropha lotti]MCG8012781.1 hypothetical protein [Candidatus Thiodiazotropha lotti]MCW4212251.1 hypothetical protein [Candidatus Thiodiazotropha lotti]MCW4218078.1 hypothetical protein [Candidatus Thiodiazotropha lotti]
MSSHLREREDQDSTLLGADALVVATKWQVFRRPAFDQTLFAFSELVVFNDRNFYDPNYLNDAGFSYTGIGRGD